MTTLPPGTSVGVNRRRPLLIFGLIVLVVAVAMGAWFFISRVLIRQSVDLTAQTATAGASAVTIELDNADATVRPSADDQLRVHATGSYSGTAPTVTAAVGANGVVQVNALCASQWLAWCSLDVVVEVPARLAVTLNGDNGDVRMQGTEADTVLYTDNGTITLDAPGGAVTAVTDNGDVIIERSSATQVKAESDNGDVTVENLVAPTSMDAKSNNGDIEVQLPAEQKYVVDAHTDNGSVDVTVGIDSDSPYKITAVTDNGSVAVRPAG